MVSVNNKKKIVKIKLKAWKVFISQSCFNQLISFKKTMHLSRCNFIAHLKLSVSKFKDQMTTSKMNNSRNKFNKMKMENKPG